MGVPAFYSWLTRRYPLIVVDAVEDPAPPSSPSSGLDLRQPNPNGYEFDNLYLDMNGIIHTCFHPENKLAPSTSEEVFESIFSYIDRIVSIVRPRKLLYLAIDGVAPRAKLNQQRSRRFRAAKDAALNEEDLREEGHVLTLHPRTETADSNVITPGTEFMVSLSVALQDYVKLRLSQDQGWQSFKVILSDASVPGEGEHKIMNYIRLQRNLPGFDPNTRHCLYGLDADLIMLALATHEMHFSILREIRNEQKCSNSELAQRCLGYQKDIVEEVQEVRYQFLQIWLLREYLEYELNIKNAAFEPDLERLIDDFVFMCFFVGNDFLPGIPTLEIRKGAINRLLEIYRSEFCNMNGYLTENGEVNLTNLEHFIRMLGASEDSYAQLHAYEGSFSSQNVAGSSSSSFDPDWKRRYYAEKFGVQDDAYEDLRKSLAFKYTEGLCWMFHYYYRGVASWEWFYPYHYAPFASDFSGISTLDFIFCPGRPLKPFDQLMGVLPPASASCLPKHYRQLMADPSSPLRDYYPEDFEIDMNGKRFPWQGVVLLPFIDLERIVEETRKLERTLSLAEIMRNSAGQDLIFLWFHHPLGMYISACIQEMKHHETTLPMCSGVSDGMNGFFSIRNGALSTVGSNILRAEYFNPPYHEHVPRPPKGAIIPLKSIASWSIGHHRNRRRSSSSKSAVAFQEQGHGHRRRRRSRSRSRRL